MCSVKQQLVLVQKELIDTEEHLQKMTDNLSEEEINIRFNLLKQARLAAEKVQTLHANLGPCACVTGVAYHCVDYEVELEICRKFSSITYLMQAITRVGQSTLNPNSECFYPSYTRQNLPRAEQTGVENDQPVEASVGIRSENIPSATFSVEPHPRIRQLWPEPGAISRDSTDPLRTIWSATEQDELLLSSGAVSCKTVGSKTTNEQVLAEASSLDVQRKVMPVRGAVLTTKMDVAETALPVVSALKNDGPIHGFRDLGSQDTPVHVRATATCDFPCSVWCDSNKLQKSGSEDTEGSISLSTAAQGRHRKAVYDPILKESSTNSLKKHRDSFGRTTSSQHASIFNLEDWNYNTLNEYRLRRDSGDSGYSSVSQTDFECKLPFSTTSDPFQNCLGDDLAWAGYSTDYWTPLPECVPGKWDFYTRSNRGVGFSYGRGKSEGYRKKAKKSQNEENARHEGKEFDKKEINLGPDDFPPLGESNLKPVKK